jgi:long-chain fatty acid transport protein
LKEENVMRRILFAAAVCLASSSAFASNGMRMTGFGPVQSSMGGAGVGATLDGTTMLYNPAGLAGLGPELQIGGTWFRPSVSYSATESPLPPGFTGAVIAQPGAAINSRRGGSPIPTLTAVFPLGERFTFGIGAFGVAGMGVDYPLNLYGGETYTSYQQARLTPALAYKVSDALFVGVTVNAMAAQMKWNVAQGFGQQLHDTATSPGIGATFGVTVIPTQWLSIGAAYETKSWFRDFSFAIPAHNGVNPATFQPVPFPAATDKLTFNQPMSATLGFAVTPIDAVLVAADVQWINWSDTNGSDKPVFSTNTSGSMAWDMGWSDQWVFKVGAQVKVRPDLRLRGGYNYGKMPLDAHCAFENLVFPAVAEHHISAGVGYDIGKVTLNAGGTYSPKASLSGANATYPAQGGQAIQSYTTTMSQVSVDVGISYRL